MDDIPRAKAASRGQCSFGSWQSLGKTCSAKFAACFQNLRAAMKMDGAVDAASAQKCAIRGIHDGVDILLCDVADVNADAPGQKAPRDF